MSLTSHYSEGERIVSSKSEDGLETVAISVVRNAFPDVVVWGILHSAGGEKTTVGLASDYKESEEVWLTCRMAVACLFSRARLAYDYGNAPESCISYGVVGLCRVQWRYTTSFVGYFWRETLNKQCKRRSESKVQHTGKTTTKHTRPRKKIKP